MSSERRSRFLTISADRAHEFFHKGYRQRHFFAHDILFLPKCGPDGFKLAQRMCATADVNQLWEVVIYAARPLIERFPRELFFDDDVVWHQQQFGKPGQIATVNLVLQGRSLYSMVHISDLVQRISRRREHKTRIENRFKGWNHMLLNSILYFAVRNEVEVVHVPTSEWAMQNTDPQRTVGQELFRRIYDRNVQELFVVERVDRWWRLQVRRNVDRLVAPEPREERFSPEKTICLCHDIERGYGHTDSDPSFAAFADRVSERNLEQMLLAESQAGVKATYNVLGLLLEEVRDRLEAGGHCIAFHSYDHRIASAAAFGAQGRAASDQLARCRAVDYRIKGYRSPQSRISSRLREELCRHNFEWLASSSYSFGFMDPLMRDRLVMIPIRFDDFSLYHDGVSYEDWERQALSSIEGAQFVAFSLHDCYAQLWLPHYAALLDKIRALGEVKTLDQVAGEVTLAHAQSFTNGAGGEESSFSSGATARATFPAGASQRGRGGG